MRVDWIRPIAEGSAGHKSWSRRGGRWVEIRRTRSDLGSSRKHQKASPIAGAKDPPLRTAQWSRLAAAWPASNNPSQNWGSLEGKETAQERLDYRKRPTRCPYRPIEAEAAQIGHKERSTSRRTMHRYMILKDCNWDPTIRRNYAADGGHTILKSSINHFISRLVGWLDEDIHNKPNDPAGL